MNQAEVGPTELARRLGQEGRITAGVVTKWRSGVQHPRLSDLPQLARALAIDPVDVAIQVGVLPSSFTSRIQVDMAIRLSEYQADVTRLHAERVSEVMRSGMAKLVEAVLEQPHWGLAVEPAFEGPTRERIHLANRLAFRRVDGVRADREEVLGEFGGLLRDLHASRSEVGGWPTNGVEPVRFSVPVYTQPRPPRSSTTHPDCSALVVVSTTIKSWAPLLARHIADDLGYGLTSGLDLAASVHAKSIDQTVSHERADQSFLLIRNPPPRYVSYHYESSEARDSRTVEALFNMANDGAKVLWLRESDDLLRFAVNNRSDTSMRARDLDLVATLSHRDQVDDAIASSAQLRARTLQIDLQLPAGSSPEVDPTALRNERIEQTIRSARRARNEMVRRGWLPAPTTPSGA